jgi:hypothetical protein
VTDNFFETRRARAAPGGLEPGQAAIGQMLQELFDRVASEPLPQSMIALLEQLGGAHRYRMGDSGAGRASSMGEQTSQRAR